MVRSRRCIPLLLLGLCHGAAADDWPTHVQAGGTDWGVKGLFQYDRNDFSEDRRGGGDPRLEDSQTWRRKEVHLFARRGPDLLVTSSYDFQSRQWLDNYLEVGTRAGRFRVGQFKTPVGWEDGNISTASTTFLERSLPEQAIYEGRRLGLMWTGQPVPHWLFQAGWFGRHDLNDEATGATCAARAVYTPVLEEGEVVHLGLAASREQRNDRTARVRARPEVGLTPIRLVDTGTLAGVDHLDRAGLEAAWIHGPLLLQGEALALRAHRPAGADFLARGGYLSGSWVMTGEHRAYKAGAIAGVEPGHAWGAWEIAVRYATLDLDDAGVRGGRERDWSLGLNGYFGEHWKVQADLIRAFTAGPARRADPWIAGLRVQLAF